MYLDALVDIAMKLKLKDTRTSTYKCALTLLYLKNQKQRKQQEEEQIVQNELTKLEKSLKQTEKELLSLLNRIEPGEIADELTPQYHFGEAVELAKEVLELEKKVEESKKIRKKIQIPQNLTEAIKDSELELNNLIQMRNFQLKKYL